MPWKKRASTKVSSELEKAQLIANAETVGKLIRDGLAHALAGLPSVVDIRGQGLMIGIELDRPCGELVARALEAGLLINVTADRVVRLLLAGTPPGRILCLTFTKAAAAPGEAQLWIVDPHGNLVLRYDAKVKGKDLLNDLRHLLKLSNIG